MHKLIRGTAFFLLFLLGTVLLLHLFNYQYILKGIRNVYFKGHTSAYLDDYKVFPNRRISSATPQFWPLHDNYNEVPVPEELKELHKDLETVAFLIIKNDSIWHESYYGNYGQDSKTNSFSMSKTIVSALLGKAIKDGYIEGLDQPVSDFFPEFYSALKVGDLSSMASGLNWDENYWNPFSMTARAYFGDNISAQILDLKVVDEPGKQFKYLSGNTQLLAMVISKATGKTLSEYLSESLWIPLGMRSPALWQLDDPIEGMEKAYCCIASNARDFAKIGSLYMHYGRWNNEQIIDSSFVARSIEPRFNNASHYGYGLWLEEYLGKKIFYMRGILGQYVIVIPEDHLIIVRLGEQRGPRVENEEHTADFYQYIRYTYDMLSKLPTE